MTGAPHASAGIQLESFEPFASLGESGRALLAQGQTHRFTRAAQTIVHKGQPVSGAYVVLEGRLRVFTISPNGVEATLYILSPGETCVLALNCVFNDLLYPAWVQAEQPSLVCVIPGAVYRRLFEIEGAVRDFTVRNLATLVYRLMSELEQVHGSHHRQRLIHFILHHASSDGVLRMTQQQVAGHIGTTREVVARLMQELVTARLVRTARGEIRISDLFGLKRSLNPVTNQRTGRGSHD
ncbi:Crp/Fnr family transcriptional regulator [Hydrogenophaga sp.]|jgi:CRP/FNR family transcriptional regulator|uniref:Crp/Fnr family transcriptional regulator n=1 Tax=Hydrogenophaga sp. TaxID=1904254 RepID=UPI002716FDDB|nr:Crp/Fnr family transcriptional regulator [Hydrogenophaga sp.]MDO9250247.1 Crp/Fnr family transcriptional regulator [Hydrogenophaga sp.]MDP2407248.1 Crp/Fnr family transcriptional regulator [Hydrogenophaga sp.]MDP3326112.1 Crp/Fnr family transcriptional regulator [Hydrogenophaga sp.]MDP3885667.1 Crp/Fnr family transcriptional regulator [Hydrogenophaga sp.]MDZ4175824.1 Crp/Fnr family transcriptional regulator [Hydrogenophaga sp.]